MLISKKGRACGICYALVTLLDGLNPPKVNNTEIFGIENVTTILDFANNQESRVTYSVNTDPQAPVMLIGNTMARLVLQYNTQYRVTVVASHRCSQNETVLELHFSKSNSILIIIITVYSKSIDRGGGEVKGKRRDVDGGQTL